MLSEYLIKEGFEVVLTREPGGTQVGEEIRPIIMNNDLNKYAQFFLFQAARFEHIEKRIRPSLQTGKIVICDRYIDSTRVYQSQIDSSLVDMCENFVLTPNITFLIDIPPSLAQERVKNRNVSNVFDNKDFDYHKDIRDRFLKLATENKNYRFVIIDGYGSSEEVFERIKNNKSFKILLYEYRSIRNMFNPS